MQTQIFYPEQDKHAIAEAAAILRRGGLLGIPTETVYGLGANALDETAVLHIFEAKGRPQDNPLILHVPGADWLERYCQDIPPVAYTLAEHFWPGPLTMILPRRPVVPLRTTGGLETVGIRCPDHPVTLAIIREADVPVAAPSGNTSGRPSPTTAHHMLEDMNGKIDGIVDGGPCAVGVESTIIDLTVTPPQLLRPGGLPLEALEEVLGEVRVDKAVRQKLNDGEKAKAPGMKYRHYAPKAPVTVITGAPGASAAHIAAHIAPNCGVICFEEYAPLFDGHIIHCLGPAGDKLAQAQHVFDALRTFDETDVAEIFAQCPDESGLGLAVSNRLKKAAGFHVIEAPRPLIVGITGPTGAGKTSALRALEQLGGYVLDCDAIYHEMLRTDGFGVFRDKEKLAYFRRLAEKRGVILLTDPDGAGFVIRNYLKGALPPTQVKQAYVPDVMGKERRKRKGGKEGKLGVEGMSPNVLLEALRRCGATFEGEENARQSAGLTRADLMDKGLIGPGSAQRRAEILQTLQLPEHLTTAGLLDALNLLLSREEFDAL